MGGCSSTTSSTDAVASSSSNQVSDMDRAILDLKNARDRLQRYRKKLEQDDAKLLQRAKQAKDADRTEQAIGLLRLRKYKQAQASACEEQLLNVLQMVETLDSKQNEKQVLEAMAAGKDTLKKMHEETTVDEVLNLMTSIKEEHDTEQEINELLQGVPVLSVQDEEAIEAELEALQAELALDTKNQPTMTTTATQQQAEQQEENTTALPDLPVAPSSNKQNDPPGETIPPTASESKVPDPILA